MSEYKLTITIDGESANDLFAVGPKDLLEFFLPDRLGVNPKDVKQISFIEDLTDEEFTAHLLGHRSRSEHRDNYFRRDDDEPSDVIEE